MNLLFSSPSIPANLLQPLLGLSSRTHNNHHIRSSILPNPIHLPRLPKHHPINLCSPGRLLLPRVFQSPQQTHPFGLPNIPHRPSPAPGRHYLLSRLSLWLRLSCTHRLPNLPPRQILQAPPSHVPAPHHLPEIIPTPQILRRRTGHVWRGPLHTLPPSER